MESQNKKPVIGNVDKGRRPEFEVYDELHFLSEKSKDEIEKVWNSCKPNFAGFKGYVIITGRPL